MTTPKRPYDQTVPPRDANANTFILSDPPTTAGGDLDDDAVVQQCLDDAVDWMHEQLPNVLADHITRKWGIGRDTIDDLRIGYLEGNGDLITHLRSSGYHPLTIARTGLIRPPRLNEIYYPRNSASKSLPEPLRVLRQKVANNNVNPAEISLERVYNYLSAHDRFPLEVGWDKRITFPYPDVDGSVRYTIGRETSDTDDFGDKYAKQTVKRPFVNQDAIFEPIYGSWTVDDGEVLLATEGIADAIMAHQHGLRCISPVAREFKRSHKQRILEHAKRASQVIIINDTDPDGNDRITSGQTGAVKTALYLDEHGINAAIGFLPAKDDKTKIDLAKFLRDRSVDDLLPVFRNALDPEETQAYDNLSKKQRNRAREIEDDWSNIPEPISVSSGSSAIYSLDITDITGLSEGYRGKNPLGHHGQTKPYSDDYFVIPRSDNTPPAYDHKYGVAYNPLTYLLCESDIRSDRSPNGNLSDREHFEAWKHAKEQGYISEDDSIPIRGMWHIARKYDLAPPESIPTSWDDVKMPATIYNRILRYVADKEGVNPGRKELATPA